MIILLSDIIQLNESMNLNEVKFVLKRLNIRPNKKLGQNFLIDKNVLNRIISESNLSKNDVVLEIGPGLGILTKKLSEKVQRVYAIELDFKLYSYLIHEFSSYSNVKFICNDALKIILPNHNKVVSNIPYSITGPLLEKLFFRGNSPVGVVLIEKSIADRICFKGDYKNFSRITITSNSFVEPTKISEVSRNSFHPVPRIDLSLVKINPKKNIDPFLLESMQREFFLSFVAGILPYKNKNMSNAIELYFKKDLEMKLEKNSVIKTLKDHNFSNQKLFKLKIEDFVNICKIFYYNK